MNFYDLIEICDVSKDVVEKDFGEFSEVLQLLPTFSSFSKNILGDVEISFVNDKFNSSSSSISKKSNGEIKRKRIFISSAYFSNEHFSQFWKNSKVPVFKYKYLSAAVIFGLIIRETMRITSGYNSLDSTNHLDISKRLSTKTINFDAIREMVEDLYIFGLVAETMPENYIYLDILNAYHVNEGRYEVIYNSENPKYKVALMFYAALLEERSILDDSSESSYIYKLLLEAKEKNSTFMFRDIVASKIDVIFTEKYGRQFLEPYSPFDFRLENDYDVNIEHIDIDEINRLLEEFVEEVEEEQTEEIEFFEEEFEVPNAENFTKSVLSDINSNRRGDDITVSFVDFEKHFQYIEHHQLTTSSEWLEFGRNLRSKISLLNSMRKNTLMGYEIDEMAYNYNRFVDYEFMLEDNLNLQSMLPQLIFLLDFSGSMRGDLMSEVAEAAYNAFIGLSTTDIPALFVAHTTKRENRWDNYGNVILSVIGGTRHFGKDVFKTRSNFERIPSIQNLDFNADGIAIQEVCKMFLPTQHAKTLVVLSDGRPNYTPATNYEDSELHTRFAISEQRQNGISVKAMSLRPEVVQTNNKLYGKSNNILAYNGMLNHSLQEVINEF
jgi:hypothetical protein